MEISNRCGHACDAVAVVVKAPWISAIHAAGPVHERIARRVGCQAGASARSVGKVFASGAADADDAADAPAVPIPLVRVSLRTASACGRAARRPVEGSSVSIAPGLHGLEPGRIIC